MGTLGQSQGQPAELMIFKGGRGGTLETLYVLRIPWESF